MSIEAFARPVVTSSFSPGSALEPRARERRALAHRHDDLERREPLDQRVVVGDVVVERGQRDRVAERRPTARADSATPW